MNVRPSQATKRKNARAAPIPLFDEDDADERQEMSPTSKRQKVVPEKRLRRYRSSMTNAIRDRIDRALHQRLYLLAATKSPNDSIYREYQVLGQTANVYTVTISHLPSCTCPDHAKGFLCKHIIFVLHRVLKVPRRSPLLYQQALLTSELNEIFTRADAQGHDSNILPERSIREGYRSATHRSQATSTQKNLVEQKPVTADDECPICFESMMGDRTKILFCSTSCGNSMHQTCFDKWQQAKISMNEPVTCPFCRTKWKVAVSKPVVEKNYLNLASYATTDDYEEDPDHYLSFNYWW